MGRRKSREKRVERSYGVLPFVLEEVEGESSVTPRAGLLPVAELARAMGLPRVVEGEVTIKERDKGPSEWEFIESLVLLMADGGECVEDLGVLGADAALVRLLGHGIPSVSAAKKFLYAFHDDEQGEKDQRQRELIPSYVPAETPELMGLGRVSGHVVRAAQVSRPERVATLDQDTTIIESSKEEAAMTYQGDKGYQPMTVLWVEQDVVLADEFRDGNVPADCEPVRVVRRAFEALPPGVEQVYYRGDTASYNHDLLNWLREEDAKTGRPRAIFAVSADMSPELRKAQMAVTEWNPDPADPCRSWAEVDFVPSGPSVKKGRKPDRYLGIRIVPRQKELFADGSEVKHFAVVTNDFERDGLAVINWQRQKAGTIEHLQDVLKNDLAAGVMPFKRFGANAAWFRLNVLTYNLLSVLRRTALPKELERARPKRLRFLVFALAATVLSHARQLMARVVHGLEEMGVWLSAVRRRIGQQTPAWEKALMNLDTS